MPPGKPLEAGRASFSSFIKREELDGTFSGLGLGEDAGDKLFRFKLDGEDGSADPANGSRSPPGVCSDGSEFAGFAAGDPELVGAGPSSGYFSRNSFEN